MPVDRSESTRRHPRLARARFRVLRRGINEVYPSQFNDDIGLVEFAARWSVDQHRSDAFTPGEEFQRDEIARRCPLQAVSGLDLSREFARLGGLCARSAIWLAGGLSTTKGSDGGLSLLMECENIITETIDGRTYNRVGARVAKNCD
jgi:hypothetical protein